MRREKRERREKTERREKRKEKEEREESNEREARRHAIVTHHRSKTYCMWCREAAAKARKHTQAVFRTHKADLSPGTACCGKH